MTLKKSGTIVTSEGLLVFSGKDIFRLNKDFHHKKLSEKKNLPEPTTIGSDPFLKSRIISLFKILNDEMSRSFPGVETTVLYKNFKRAFGIKNNKWKIIFEYPVECADEIIQYLESKYNNIILGKNLSSGQRKIYIQPGKFMYLREVDLLAEIGFTYYSNEVKKIFTGFFEVSSHKELSLNQHWQFIKYLEALADS